MHYDSDSEIFLCCRYFEKICQYCNKYSNLIPVAFILGFYVTIVVQRWWDQFNSIPWPDRMALFVTSLVQGHDDRGRMVRRTIMRYMCLSFVIVTSSISPAVRKRFPTFSHMTEAGFHDILSRNVHILHTHVLLNNSFQVL